MPTTDIGISIAGRPLLFRFTPDFVFRFPLGRESILGHPSVLQGHRRVTRRALRQPLLTTGTAKFMNLRSRDDRESGRSASPSGTSTVNNFRPRVRNRIVSFTSPGDSTKKKSSKAIAAELCEKCSASALGRRSRRWSLRRNSCWHCVGTSLENRI